MEGQILENELRLKEQLRQFLEASGLTAAELARRSNVPRQTISDWLAGAPPRSMIYLKRVADVMNCSLEELLFDGDCASPGGGINLRTNANCRIGEVLKANRDMIGYWDSQLKNIYANDAYIDYFGRTPEEMRGKSLAEVLGPDLFARNFPYIKGALEGRFQAFEREFITQSGELRLTVTKYLPDIEGGKVRGFVAIVTDISKFK